MNVFTFDTEDDSHGNCYLWNFYHLTARTHFTFLNREEALDFVFEQGRATFWAVNLEYDVNNLFKENFKYLRIIYSGSKMIVAEIESLGARFLDTLNHWPMSVKAMGERIGLPKLEYNHDGKIPKSKRALNKAIHYCRRDTEIAGEFVSKMLLHYASISAPCKTTISATSLNYFEQNFYRKVTHRFKEKHIDFFHGGYYGGRTEIFHNRPVRGSIFYSDVNSLYPAVMRSGEFPVLERYYYTKKPNFQACGMAEITVECPRDILLPYLPHRHKKKLIYPTGIWRARYTYFQIREAVKLGYRVKRVHKAIEFPGKHNPFIGFVDFIYKERLTAQAKGDDLLSQIFKSFGNNHYGKYAQGNVTTELVHISSVTEIPDGAQILDGEMLLIHKKKDYPRHANCIWAAYVTSQAHHILYTKGLKRVMENGGQILYCDTDSVFYKADKIIIPHSKDLGEFKLEKIFDYAHFKLPKMYELRHNGIAEFKTKGVPKAVRPGYFSGNKVFYKKPMKLRETLRRNTAKTKINKFTPNMWVENSKEIRGIYDKRVVLSSGATIPLHLLSEKRKKT